jgi:hypothetical protein
MDVDATVRARLGLDVDLKLEVSERLERPNVEVVTSRPLGAEAALGEGPGLGVLVDLPAVSGAVGDPDEALGIR